MKHFVGQWLREISGGKDLSDTPEKQLYLTLIKSHKKHGSTHHPLDYPSPSSMTRPQKRTLFFALRVSSIVIPWTLVSFEILLCCVPLPLIHAFPLAPKRQRPQQHGRIITQDHGKHRRHRYALSSSELKPDESNGKSNKKSKQKKTKKKSRRKKSSPTATTSERSSDGTKAAAQKQAEAKKEQGEQEEDDVDEELHLGTVQQLFELINQEIRNRGSQSGDLSFVEEIENPWREDSMLEYDRVQDGRSDGDLSSTTATTTATTTTTTTTKPKETSTPGALSDLHHVALIFSKSLIKDQITVEYSSRIQKLVRSIQDKSYRPSLICFIASGDVTSASSNHEHNHLEDTTAGYLYFLHLCASHGISLQGIDFFLDQKSKSTDPSLSSGGLLVDEQKQDQQEQQKDQILQKQQQQQQQQKPIVLNQHNPVLDCMQHIQQKYLNTWLQESPEWESPSEEYGLKRRQPRKKVRIHFTLFSTDYHLCNLDNIHRQSPRQSLLKPMNTLKQKMSKNNYQNDPNHPHLHQRGIVDTSWTYCYCVHPFLYASDPIVAFMAKCYLLGEELVPLLVNLRGVVNNMEFFQRDNYELLVSVRSALVSDMEQLYQLEPCLKSSLRRIPSNIFYSMDIIVEGVLLALGRCQDLVRPAGGRSVPKSDWDIALNLIEHCLKQIKEACDPDIPLDPHEWGKLGGGSSSSGTSTSSEDTTIITTAATTASSECMTEESLSMTHWRTKKRVDLN